MNSDIGLLVSGFESDMIKYTIAATTIAKVQELVAVINRNGLQESIKDLFGADLAQLSPAYAAGKDTAIVVAELNMACEGLGQQIWEVLKEMWKKFVEFVKSLWHKLFSKAEAVTKKIKEADTRVKELKNLAATPQSEHKDMRVDMYPVLMSYKDFMSFVTNDHVFIQQFPSIVEDIKKDHEGALAKHKDILTKMGLIIYDRTSNNFVVASSFKSEAKTIIEHGYPKTIEKLNEFTTMHAGWKEQILRLPGDAAFVAGISTMTPNMLADIEKNKASADGEKRSAIVANHQRAIRIITDLSKIYLETTQICIFVLHSCAEIILDYTTPIDWQRRSPKI